LGLREFAAYFEEYQPSPDEKQPISDTLDAGLMVYDIFDFVHDIKVQKKTKPALSLFHAIMEQGVIQVPPYESPKVLKGASRC
jgi:CRISPR-associated protein Cas5d